MEDPSIRRYDEFGIRNDSGSNNLRGRANHVRQLDHPRGILGELKLQHRVNGLNCSEAVSFELFMNYARAIP